MEKNDLYSMLGVLDHTVLTALPRAGGGASSQGTSVAHHHVNHHHHHHHIHHPQFQLATSLFASTDFEPTPINEPSAAAAAAATRPDESQLLRQVLTQANNVISETDNDFLLFGNPYHHSAGSASLLGNPSSFRTPTAATAASLRTHAAADTAEGNLLPDASTSVSNPAVAVSESAEADSSTKAAQAKNNTTDSSAASAVSASLSPTVTSGRWYDRYQDLVKFKEEFGHCCVPSHWPRNPPLAQWVKRQRHQFKRSKDGLHSTITPGRIEVLNKMEFVWDPHAAFWEERLGELHKFRDKYGHCNVPTKFPDNPQLAIWAKCQRRQFKLYVSDGPKKSNMTVDRIAKLSRVGFVFNPRQINRRKH